MEEFNQENLLTPQPKSERYKPLPFTIFVLLAIFFLYQVVGGGITLWIFGTSVTQENVQAMRIATMIAQIMFLFIPTLLLIKQQHGTFANCLPRRIPTTAEIILTIVGVFSLQQILQVYMYFQEKIPLPHVIEPFVEQMKKMIEETYRVLALAQSTPELLLIIVVVALTPSLCEEFLFRALVQKNFSLATNKKIGFILTGIIFAMYHLNPFLIIPLMVLGIYFSFLSYRSETIILPIIAHFTNNCSSIVGLYMEQHSNLSDVPLISDVAQISLSEIVPIAVGAIIIFSISFYFYLKITSSISEK